MFKQQWFTNNLRWLQRQLGEQIEPHLVVASTDPRWRGTDLVPCDAGGLPSLDPGTEACCRISTGDGADGLHIAFDNGVVAIHLDRVDARRDPIGHGFDATRLAAGAAVGAGIGGLVALATGKPFLALVGAGIGGAIGATTGRRTHQYFRVRGDGQLELLAAETRQGAGALVLHATW